MIFGRHLQGRRPSAAGTTRWLVIHDWSDDGRDGAAAWPDPAVMAHAVWRSAREAYAYRVLWSQYSPSGLGRRLKERRN